MGETDKVLRKKEENDISTSYKFFLDGELTGEEFRDILKARGYTVIIEGASREKLGFFKGVFYAMLTWLVVLLTLYVLHTVLVSTGRTGLL